MSYKYKTFSIVPVLTLSQALKMRNIRNRVRVFMTHNTEEIGVAQQTIWYYTKLKPSDDRAYLVVNEAGWPVGYGLVTLRANGWNVTGALLEDYRGLGMGRTLFRFLTQDALLSSGKDVYLDVRLDNEKAIRLYLSLGYLPTGPANGGVLKMKWSGELVSD